MRPWSGPLYWCLTTATIRVGRCTSTDGGRTGSRQITYFAACCSSRAGIWCGSLMNLHHLQPERRFPEEGSFAWLGLSRGAGAGRTQALPRLTFSGLQPPM